MNIPENQIVNQEDHDFLVTDVDITNADQLVAGDLMFAFSLHDDVTVHVAKLIEIQRHHDCFYLKLKQVNNVETLELVKNMVEDTVEIFAEHCIRIDNNSKQELYKVTFANKELQDMFN